jgi:hypothetical protein
MEKILFTPRHFNDLNVISPTPTPIYYSQNIIPRGNTDSVYYRAGVDILPNSAVCYDIQAGRVIPYNTNNINLINTFLGIAPTGGHSQSTIEVRLQGIISNIGFNWDVSKEIYAVGETGELTQDIDITNGSMAFVHKVADVLTPTMIIITHVEPTVI